MTTQFTAQAKTTPGILTINGHTLASLGCFPVRLDGPFSMGAVERTLATTPSVSGSLAAPYVTIAPRTITCNVVLVAPTFADQLPMLEKLRLVTSGMVELGIDAASYTVLRAECVGLESEPALGRWGSDSALVVSMTFQCYDTARYRRDCMMYAVTSDAPTPIVHGDLPGVARYEHHGPTSTEVVLSLLGPEQRVRSSLTFTADLSSSQRLLFDWGTGRIEVLPDGGLPGGFVLAGGPWLTWASDGGLDARTNPDAAMRVHLSTGYGLLFLREAWSI